MGEHVEYVVRFQDGYFYQALGGGGWCGTSHDSATRFQSRYEAERVAWALRSRGAEVEEAD